MDPTTIPEPKLTQGESYSWPYSAYLHVGAAVLRTLVWCITGHGKEFDRYVEVDTPGLGTGKARCGVCFPRRQQHQRDHRYPLVLVLEGGGFVLGQPEDGEHNDRLISDQTNSIVVSVNYAKAPRHPYPHSLVQIYQVLRWFLSADAEREGIYIDASRVAVMGNSAGGNLTASLSTLLSISTGPCARFRESLPLNFRQVLQILLYPSLECHQLYRSRFRRCSSPEVQAKSLPVSVAELMEASYLPPHVQKEQIFVAPAVADVGLLEQLQIPKAVFITAGLDCLKDEAELYARKLQDAGVAVHVKQYSHAIHGFSHYKEGSKDFRREDVKGCWNLVCESLQKAFA